LLCLRCEYLILWIALFLDILLIFYNIFVTNLTIILTTFIALSLPKIEYLLRKPIYYLPNSIQLFNNIYYHIHNIRMQISKKTITLSPMDRIIMILCYIAQLILFLYFNLLIIHYTFLPMPTIFSASSLVSS